MHTIILSEEKLVAIVQNEDFVRGGIHREMFAQTLKDTISSTGNHVYAGRVCEDLMGRFPLPFARPEMWVRPRDTEHKRELRPAYSGGDIHGDRKAQQEAVFQLNDLMLNRVLDMSLPLPRVLITLVRSLLNDIFMPFNDQEMDRHYRDLARGIDFP